MAMGRAERVERGSRDRGLDVITKIFINRTELRLKTDVSMNKFVLLPST